MDLHRSARCQRRHEGGEREWRGGRDGVPGGDKKGWIKKNVFDKSEQVVVASGVGSRAEKGAKQWKVTREAEEAFAVA